MQTMNAINYVRCKTIVPISFFYMVYILFLLFLYCIGNVTFTINFLCYFFHSINGFNKQDNLEKHLQFFGIVVVIFLSIIIVYGFVWI